MRIRKTEFTSFLLIPVHFIYFYSLIKYNVHDNCFVISYGAADRGPESEPPADSLLEHWRHNSGMCQYISHKLFLHSLSSTVYSGRKKYRFLNFFFKVCFEIKITDEFSAFWLVGCPATLKTRYRISGLAFFLLNKTGTGTAELKMPYFLDYF